MRGRIQRITIRGEDIHREGDTEEMDLDTDIIVGDIPGTEEGGTRLQDNITGDTQTCRRHTKGSDRDKSGERVRFWGGKFKVETSIRVQKRFKICFFPPPPIALRIRINHCLYPGTIVTTVASGTITTLAVAVPVTHPAIEVILRNTITTTLIILTEEEEEVVEPITETTTVSSRQ